MSWSGPPSSPFGHGTDGSGLPPGATSPPAMPVAGWYPDPEHVATWRYWDGQRWTPNVAPMHVAAPRDPHSFGAWFEDSTAAVKAVLRRVGIVLVAVYLALFGGFLLILVGAWRSDTGEELRRLLNLDDMFTAGGATVELTDAQADRAVDLLGDLLREWWLPAAVLVVVMAVVSVWALSLTATVAWDHVDGPDAPEHRSIIERPSAWSTSMRRLPVVVVSALVLTGLVVSAMAVPLLPLVVAVAADASAEVVALAAVIGGITSLVLAFYVGVRLALAIVLAVRGGHGLGISRSWTLTGDHFWATVGRLAIAGLLASVVSMPFGFSNGFGFSFGFWFAAIVVLIAQALSAAASVLIQVPAQVVMAVHLAAQHGEQQSGQGRRPGSPAGEPWRGPLG